MFDKPKKKKRPYSPWLRLRWFLLTSLIAILGFFGFAIILPVCGCSISPSRDVEGESARTQIEQHLGMTLPDSVSNLHYYYNSLQVVFMQSRFDLPADDVSAFLDNISLICMDKLLQDNVIMFGSPNNKKAWWHPHTAEQFVRIEECGDNPYWQLMIDQSDDDIWVVYILEYSR